VTDLDALARQLDATAPTSNGRDPLEASGLTALTVGADLGDVAVCLRQLQGLLPADALDRRVLRGRAIAALERIKVPGAAGWVDTALPSGTSATADALQGQAVALKDPELWPEEVDGEELLEALVAIQVKYVKLTTGAPTAGALYAIHTHALDAADVSPYLVAKSPTKQCGKTTFLRVQRGLVRRPIATSNMSAASLYRIVEQASPTLLIDEADTFARLSDDLKGILNAGYGRDDAVVWRVEGDEREPRGFRVFCPKAFATTGPLPDTVEDRSIIIPMARKAPGDKVARSRRRDLARALLPLQRKIARWAHDHLEALRAATPEIPVELTDRQADSWEPLLAIADLVGGVWPKYARQAALLLSNRDGEDVQDIREQLLVHFHVIFEARAAEAIFSADVAQDLGAMEGTPWPEYGRQRKPITPNAIARLLKPFGVGPKSVRVGETTAKGYRREWLVPLWQLYRILQPSQPSQTNNDNELDAAHNRHNAKSVTVDETGLTPSAQAPVGPTCDGVTVVEGGLWGKGDAFEGDG
jgi:hypothetical protein